MIGCSEKNTENYPKKCYEQKKKKPGLKFNPGLELIRGPRTAGSRTASSTIPVTYQLNKTIMRHMLGMGRKRECSSES